MPGHVADCVGTYHESESGRRLLEAKTVLVSSSSVVPARIREADTKDLAVTWWAEAKFDAPGQSNSLDDVLGPQKLPPPLGRPSRLTRWGRIICMQPRRSRTGMSWCRVVFFGCTNLIEVG